MDHSIKRRPAATIKARVEPNPFWRSARYPKANSKWMCTHPATQAVGLGPTPLSAIQNLRIRARENTTIRQS